LALSAKMAPQIQPGSLYQLSLSCVSNLIDQVNTKS
jgi:hypothetical protein